MEEDKKILIELIDSFKHLKYHGWINDIKRDIDIEKVIQAIENILEEVERLSIYDNIENQKYLYGNIETNYIPISVIQNKIDELKIAGVTKTLNNGNELIEEHYFLQDEIDVLQELLEERNK